MDISVVIGTRNRALSLGTTLDALALQEIGSDRLEIIVVDDASSDATPEICRARAAAGVRIAYLRQEEPAGLAVARNKGVAASRGGVILFTDDDCRPESDWAARMREGLARFPIVAGAVGISLPGYVRYGHHLSAFHPFLPRGEERPIRFMAGANMGFRREALSVLGAFDPALRLAQDFEMCLRARAAGHEIRFLPRAVVLHETPRSTLKQAFDHTAAHAAATVAIRGRYAGLFRAGKIFRSPALLALCSPALALGATARAVAASPDRLRALRASPLVLGLKIAWCWGAVRSPGKRSPCPG